MTDATPLYARPDTFLGVCEALGQDLGVPSNLLRVAFGVALILSPLWVLGGYLALGATVVVTRRVWLRTVADAAAAPAVNPPVRGDNDAEPAVLAEAA